MLASLSRHHNDVVKRALTVEQAGQRFDAVAIDQNYASIVVVFLSRLFRLRNKKGSKNRGRRCMPRYPSLP
jgi:hypothetical protein